MPDLQPVEYDPFNPTVLPVEHDPFSPAFAGLGATPKTGQQLPSQNVAGDVAQFPQRAAGFLGDLSGVSDAMKAWRGEMTEDEARTFALGALPGLIPGVGQEAKVAEHIAEEAAPAIAKGIRAFHGSPYDFNAFDLSKIGTGEGAQAYGHGLYFAENPATAQDYKSKLSTLANVNDSPEAKTALYYLQQNKFDKTAARADFEDRLRQKLPDNHPTVEAINNYDPGKMYEVNINADPDHFLDWDKPLSEQSGHVQGAIQRAGLSPQEPDLGEFAGQRISGAPRWADTPEQMAKLRDAGIPGIKYLDQGSRPPRSYADTLDSIKYYEGVLKDRPGDPDAQQQLAQYKGDLDKYAKGTSNYVVFNDKLIDIVKKYGIAGLVAGGAAHYSTQPVDHDPFQ